MEQLAHFLLSRRTVLAAGSKCQLTEHGFAADIVEIHPDKRKRCAQFSGNVQHFIVTRRLRRFGISKFIANILPVIPVNILVYLYRRFSGKSIRNS